MFLLVTTAKLREHKFKHSFQDTLNPFCSCGLGVETNTHFLLYCQLFNNQWCTLLSVVNGIDSSFTNTNHSMLISILLFGKASLDTSPNALILNATMNYHIKKQVWRSLIQYFVIFCYILISLTFFCILMSFFETTYSYLCSSQVCFFYVLTLLFYILFLFIPRYVTWVFKALGDCNFLFYITFCFTIPFLSKTSLILRTSTH